MKELPKLLITILLTLATVYLGFRNDSEVGEWLRGLYGVSLSDSDVVLVEDGWIYHRVRRGEMLTEIAARYGLSWQTIWDWNRDTIPNPDILPTSTILRICVQPDPGRKHFELDWRLD